MRCAFVFSMLAAKACSPANAELDARTPDGGAAGAPASNEEYPASTRRPPLVDDRVPLAERAAVSLGVVVEVDLQRGTLTIDVGGPESLTVHAPPDLLRFVPGEIITIEHRTYGDREWLVQHAPSDIDSMERGVVRGGVEALDRSSGSLTVNGVRMRAHPEQLRGLLPGQFVEVTFARLGGERWLQTTRR